MQTKENLKQARTPDINKVIIAIIATVILVALLVVGGNIYTQNNYINWKKEEDKKALEQVQSKEALRIFNLQACESNVYESYLEALTRLCNYQVSLIDPSKAGINLFKKEDIRRQVEKDLGGCLLFDKLAKEPEEIRKNI
jgi:hypothetical protein